MDTIQSSNMENCHNNIRIMNKLKIQKTIEI
jgi:hypothetical protein